MWQAFIINILYDLQILVERQVHKSNPTTNTNPENPSPLPNQDQKKTMCPLPKSHPLSFYQCPHPHPTRTKMHLCHPCAPEMVHLLVGLEGMHPWEVIQCQWRMSIGFMAHHLYPDFGLHLHLMLGVETWKSVSWEVDKMIQGQTTRMKCKGTVNPKSILFITIIR